MALIPSFPASTAHMSILVILAGAIAVIEASVDVSWHRPSYTDVNNLAAVLSGANSSTRIFDSSTTPDNLYGIYNYCNMPHVRAREYPVANSTFELKYVEVIHRHHKRTPYLSNTFPKEDRDLYCSDSPTYYYAKSVNGDITTPSYWNMYVEPANPLNITGFKGDCQFPQITREGLEDAHQHGKDLFSVYGDKLKFLPVTFNPKKVLFRVTSNVITSQTASAIAKGMYGNNNNDVPLYQQYSAVDSLQPQYSCSYADSVRSGYQGSNANWTAHLTATQDLFKRLDGLSGVNPSDSGWHSWFDHYFDNLSSRLCHQMKLPCKIGSPSECVSRADAEKVFRLGLYEYSYIFRDAPQSLEYARTKYGLYFVELIHHMRHVISGECEVKYRHNVAHDGSISPVLSFLQVDEMVWPGMGAEVTFELFEKKATGEWFVRVLWGGRVMRSSAFGEMDMVPVENFFAYVEGLTGARGSYVVQKCG
ncbi:histidine phosphatase superfamily, partial [Cladochytrium replicatum]